MSERVEIAAEPDATLRAGLERRRATAGEGIEDDIAAARVAPDERVGKCGREAREVRAHRVERVAPQPLLVLPFRGDRHRRQLRGAIEVKGQGELGGSGLVCRHRLGRDSSHAKGGGA